MTSRFLETCETVEESGNSFTRCLKSCLDNVRDLAVPVKRASRISSNCAIQEWHFAGFLSGALRTKKAKQALEKKSNVET